jgi:hypothetical protein
MPVPNIRRQKYDSIITESGIKKMPLTKFRRMSHGSITIGFRMGEAKGHVFQKYMKE